MLYAIKALLLDCACQCLRVIRFANLHNNVPKRVGMCTDDTYNNIWLKMVDGKRT